MHSHLGELANRAQGPLLFWGRSLRNPRQICSLFPSSPFVGRAMTEAIAKRPAPHVVELGAGTGAITRQLIRNGVAPQNLTLVELDTELGQHLRRTFPEIDVLIAPAQDLGHIWSEREGPRVGAVVSTLPMRLFSKPLIRSIMKNSFRVIAPGGMFVQFTYRDSSPVPLRIAAALGLRAERRCLVWANLPPAAIWTYDKID
jgi:phosphatidylethanolamine/phosphatidyl-N-methylethanolamine N-methyltransferase